MVPSMHKKQAVKASKSNEKTTKKNTGLIPKINHAFEREALFFALCGLCAFYFVSIYSFYPTDPSIISAQFPEKMVINLGGRVGAYISGLMVYSFGLCSYLLPLPLLISSYLMIRVRKGAFSIIRFTSWVTLMVCSSAVMSKFYGVYDFSGVTMNSGGVVGHYFNEQINVFFGQIGGQIFILVSCLCAAILVLRREVLAPTGTVIRAASSPITRVKPEIQVGPTIRSTRSYLKKKLNDLSKFRPGKNRKSSSEDELPTYPQVGDQQPQPQALNVFEPLHEDQSLAFKAAQEVSDISLGEPDFLSNVPASTAQKMVGDDTKKTYTPPSSSIFRSNPDFKLDNAAKIEFKETADILVKSFADFQITGEVIAIQPGPVVTVYEFQPKTGTKINKVMGLLDDIALSLKVDSIFINPVAGKRALGVQVPNKKRELVFLGDVIRDETFVDSESPLTFGMGKSLSGRPICADLTGMPHLLAAGATGAGKSVAINALLCSVIMKASPEDVKMILVDPKMLELSIYEGIPHLLTPVITEPQKASLALRWATIEMEKRYKMMQLARVRHITGFNKYWKTATEAQKHEIMDVVEDDTISHMPYIMLVIDELADLMLTAPKDVENSIQRLAQKARACGIHLVLATQRPSVDVITGIIKANLPCRIAFQTVSKHDSRTILDQIGADKLLGKGDMLFQKPGTSRAQRVQGAFITDEEVLNLVEEVKKSSAPDYDQRLIGWLEEEAARESDGSGATDSFGSIDDEPKWDEAISIAQSQGAVSASFLQRQLKIGYNRAARIVESMQKQGLVGPADGSKPRKWLGSKGEYNDEV